MKSDFLFGRGGSASLDDDRESDDDRMRTAPPPHGDRDSSDSDDGDHVQHYLEREVNASAWAAKFTRREEDEEVSDGDEEDSFRTGWVDGTPEACGGQPERLHHDEVFDMSEIELTRLNMREMLKEEKDLLILGLLESARHAQTVTKGGNERKRRREKFDYIYRGA